MKIIAKKTKNVLDKHRKTDNFYDNCHTNNLIEGNPIR